MVRYCLKWCGQRPPCAKRTFPRRAFPPLSTGPSLKTERFQRGRSCGTGGNPVRGAPARLHRHKQFVRGGSGGRHAAWKPCRPPAAFGSFPLRERNSHVRRRAKFPQAASSPSPVCLLFPHLTLRQYRTIRWQRRRCLFRHLLLADFSIYLQ